MLDKAESGALVGFEDRDFLTRKSGDQGCGHG